MMMMLYRKALVVCVASALFSNLALFLMNSQLIPFTVTHLTLALAVASMPLVLALPEVRTWPWPLMLWSLGFLILSTVFVVGTTTYLNELDHFRDRVFGVFFLFSMLVIFADPRVHRFSAGAIACVLVFSIALNGFEVFNPGTFSMSEGRSAGLYENPNQSGAALILAMIVALEVVGPKYRVPLALATGLGVLVTLSRSAIVAWFVVTVLSFGLRGQLKGLVRYVVVLGVVLGIAVVAIKPDVVGILMDSGTLNRNTTSRATMEVGSESDGSRYVAATEALDVIAEHPFLGRGTGASTEPPFDQVGPHNIYLALMVDHGILGLLILPMFIRALTREAPRPLKPVTIPLAFFLAYWGLFSHNVLDERYFLVVVALVASAVAAGRARGPEKGVVIH